MKEREIDLLERITDSHSSGSSSAGSIQLYEILSEYAEYAEYAVTGGRKYI